MLEEDTGYGFGAPIFVIGAARSGTTLLQTMLGAHPSIAALPEMHFWLRIVNLADYWGDVAEPDRFRAALDELVSLPAGLLERAGFEPDRMMATVSFRQSPEYRDLLDAAGRDLARRQGKRRWSEKTPWQTADQIWALFPEAQVIHLVREPRDTVASIVRAPFNDQPVAGLARQWARYTRANIRSGTARGPEHYHQVRYEDLVGAPLASLGLICRFLGEEFESSMLLRREDSTALFSRASGRPLPWQASATGPLGALGPGGKALSGPDRAVIGAAIRGGVGLLGYDDPRRRTVLVGLLLRSLAAPRHLYARLRRLRHRASSPEERHRAVQRYTRERVAAALATPPALPGCTDDESHPGETAGAVAGSSAPRPDVAAVDGEVVADGAGALAR